MSASSVMLLFLCCPNDVSEISSRSYRRTVIVTRCRDSARRIACMNDHASARIDRYVVDSGSAVVKQKVARHDAADVDSRSAVGLICRRT